MALKKQQEIMTGFSMASMTDVVFLLLVFFMVTSSFVFPTALEIDLPSSSQQTALKPTTRVYVDSLGAYYVSAPQAEAPIAVSPDSLAIALLSIAPADSLGAVAVYGHSQVPYGKVVEILNIGSANDIKMVLATKPADAAQQPETPQNSQSANTQPAQ